MLIFGIDPSLTGTAVAAWQSGVDQPIIRRFTSAPAPTLVGRFERYQSLARHVSDLMSGKDLSDAAVFIEGYSFGSANKAIPLAEYGGILRASLLKFVAPVYEVSPPELKKFATGKGNSEKEVLRAHVARRWGVIHDTNDETDAFVLGWLGLCYTGAMECDNAVQRDVIAKLKAGPVAKKRKPRTPA